MKLSEDKIESNKDRILQEAKQKEEKVAEIDDQANGGFDSIVRYSLKVDKLTVQGREVERRAIEDITSIKRSKSVKVNFSSNYTIDGVDTTDPRGFIVKLRDIKTDRQVTATLFDEIGKEKFGSVIRRAEWGKTRIVVRLAAKEIGDELREATILKAHTARIARQDR